MERYLKTPEEAVRMLKEGKKVQNDYMEYWLSEGIFYSLNKKDGYVCINSNIFFKPDCMFIEETEPLKLEVGKFYKTRAGKKAIIYSFEKRRDWPFYVAELGGDCYIVTEQGKFYNNETISELDLVAPWEE